MLIRKLHRDEGGQAMVLVTIVLFTLLCFFAFVYNVGYRVSHKVTVQNTIDSSVYSAAVWNARGMNLICILNVGMAECLAWFILDDAYQNLYDVVTKALPLNFALAEAMIAIPYTSAAGAAWKAALEVADKWVKTVCNPFRKAMNIGSDNVFKPAMKSLKAIEKVVRLAAPANAFFRASEIAKAKGMTPFVDDLGLYVLIFPVNPLPLVDGVFSDLCPPTREKGPWNPDWMKEVFAKPREKTLDFRADLGLLSGVSEYTESHMVSMKDFLAWTWLPTNVMIPPPNLLWDSMVKWAGDSYCNDGNSNAENLVAVNTRDLDLCLEKNGKANDGGQPIWTGGVTCEPIGGGEKCSGEGSGGDYRGYLNPSDTYLVSRNPAKAREPDAIAGVCKPANCPDCDPVEALCYKEYILKECIVKEKYEGGVQMDSSKKEEVPMVLDDEWQKQLRFTALAKKDVFHPAYLYRQAGDSSEKTVWAISCAEVHNPVPDMFNQDWQVRLKPCRVDEMNLDAMGISSELSGLIGGTGGIDVFRSKINEIVGELLVH